MLAVWSNGVTSSNRRPSGHRFKWASGVEPQHRLLMPGERETAGELFVLVQVLDTDSH